MTGMDKPVVRVEFAPRPIEPRDLEGVYSLIAACYREYGLTLNLNDPCESHLHDPGHYFRGHGGEFWVVEERGAGVVGRPRVMATAALVVHHDRTPPVGELKSMYVDSSWRRQGIGRRLVDLVMDAARHAGCREMELWSDTRFVAAHAMYEAAGFTRFGRRDIEDSNNSSEFGFRRLL